MHPDRPVRQSIYERVEAEGLEKTATRTCIHHGTRAEESQSGAEGCRTRLGNVVSDQEEGVVVGD